MNRGVSFSNPSFKELLEKGRVVEVTHVGSICGLEEFEYCTRDRCRYWNKEGYCCERFVWVSILFDGKYLTAILPVSKAKEQEKIAKFIR